jgi:hypothetical protein
MTMPGIVGDLFGPPGVHMGGEIIVSRGISQASCLHGMLNHSFEQVNNLKMTANDHDMLMIERFEF